MTTDMNNYEAIDLHAGFARVLFDCQPAENKVAIIALACGTVPGDARTVRDFYHDARIMLDVGIRHIDQVAEFAKNILNATQFDTTHYDEWADMFDLGFDGDAFGHFMLEKNEDMRAVVDFCYPFDGDRNLTGDGNILFCTAFCH